MRLVGASTTSHFHLGVDMGDAIYYLGGILSFVGWIWLIVVGFQASALWGIIAIIPCVNLVWVVKGWPATMRPFLLMFGGGVVQTIGQLMGGGPQFQTPA